MLSRLPVVISSQRAVSPINFEPRSILTLLKSQMKREILHPKRSS